VVVSLEPDRTYRVEVVTDAASLLTKLLAAAGKEPAASLGAEDLRNRLRALDEVFRRKLTLAFDDDTNVHPAISYAVASPSQSAADVLSPPVATIVLTGALPRAAAHLTWTYGWTFASYALTVRQTTAREPVVVWLEGGQTSRPFSLTAPAPPMGRFEIAGRYLGLGFTHILPKGLDHMLFVLGIFLLSRRLRQVLWQVSAFTVAHSITLGLSIYGILSVPAAVVEPLIALSIAYVAIENLFVAEVRARRIALVFLFGLLHGMGFAGALKEVGLPRSEFLTALVTFNLGVEGGQLAVIGIAFVLVGWYCRRHAWYHRRVVMPASAIMACVAVYWTLQRLPF
jgi:hypothetical protein